MAFTIQDVQDLLRLLREHPEWRDAVRREVLTEELLGLPELVRRLADGQADLTARMDQLIARMEGRAGRAPDAAERFVAVEVSKEVDSRDVQRAHDRASLLTRLGLETIPAVGGSRLSGDAAALADQLGVRTLLGWIDDDR